MTLDQAAVRADKLRNLRDSATTDAESASAHARLRELHAAHPKLADYLERRAAKPIPAAPHPPSWQVGVRGVVETIAAQASSVVLGAITERATQHAAAVADRIRGAPVSQKRRYPKPIVDAVGLLKEGRTKGLLSVVVVFEYAEEVAVAFTDNCDLVPTMYAALGDALDAEDDEVDDPADGDIPDLEG